MNVTAIAKQSRHNVGTIVGTLTLCLYFTACTSSVQTTDDWSTVTAPPDSGYGTIYSPYRPVGYNPYCDSLRIAQELLRRAYAEMEGQAESYKLTLETVLEGKEIEAGEVSRVIGELNERIQYYRARVHVSVNEPPKPVPVPQDYLDRIASIIAQRNKAEAKVAELEAEAWTLWDKLAYAAAFILAGLFLAFFAPFLSKIRAFISP